ncbi:hypothetical protein BKA69DRAFT_802158 [Paraphysoderma sedebokerense]|nr:hypothetical protein BKA69DRAFT_802158 [Paraphysoderma sedebokerense]
MLRATSTENKDPNNSELQQYQQSFSYISAIERPQTSRNPSGSHNPPTFSFDQLLTPSTNVHRQTNVNDQDGLITFSSTPNGSPSRKSLSGSQRKDIDISYEHDLSKRPWDVPELAEEWVENEDGGNLMAELDLTENKQFDSLRLDQNEKSAEQEQKISSVVSTPNQSTDVTGFSAQNPPSSGHQYETAPQTPAHFPVKSSKQSLQQQLFQQRLLKADSETEMQFGTVQVNSIGNVPQSYDANVWGKRRFKDIFSPLTLENLFQPPTAKKSDVSQHRQQQETDSAEELSHQQKSPLQQIVIPEDLKRSLNMSVGTNGSKDDWSPKLEYSDVEGSLIYNSSPDRQIEYSGIADITFDENDFDFGMNDGNQHSFDNSMPPESAAIIEEFQRRNEHDLRETEQVSLLIGSRLPVVENGHSQIQSVPDKVMSSSQFQDNLLSQNLESSASNRNRVHTPEDPHDNIELPFDEGADQQSQNDSLSDVRDASISLQLRASLDENIQHENDKEFSFDTKDGTDVERFQLGQETTTSTFPPFNYDTFTRERISAIVNQMESGKAVAGSHSQKSFNSSINESSSRPMVSSFDIPNDPRTEEQENSFGGISCNLDGGMSKSSTGLSIPNSVDDTSVSAFDHLRRGQNLLEEIRQNMSQSQQSNSALYNERQDEEHSIAMDNVEIGGLPDEGELNAVRSQMEELGHFLHEQPQPSHKNDDSRVSSHDRDRFFQHSSFSDSPEFSSPSHSSTFEDQKFGQEIADDEVSGLSNQVRRIRIAVEASPNDMGKEYQRLPASTNVDEILSSRHRANVRSPHFNPIPKKAVLIQQPNNSSVVYPDNIDDLDCTPDESNFSNAPTPAYEERKPIGVYFAPTSTHNVSIKPVKDDDEYPSDIDFVESVSDAESMTSEVNHAAGDSRSNNQKSDNFKPVKKRMGQIRNLNIAHHKAKSNPNICGQPESLKPSERQTNMIRINPTDADNLPDKIGNMIFDKIRNCWVELNPVSEVSKLDGPSASGIILNPRTDEFSGISNISSPSSASGSSHIRAKPSRLREDAFANSMNTDSDAGTTGISDHVGSMVFDRLNKRWVEMNTKDHTKSVTMNGESDMMTGDAFLEEDTDPFREIEEEAEKSFEDECESNQFRASAIESTCFDHTKEKSSDQPVKTSFGHATEKLEKPQPESMSQSPKSERKDKAIDETLMDDTINDFGIPLVQPGSIAQAADRISRQDFAGKTISDENLNHTRKESGMDGIFDIPTFQNPHSVPNFDYLDHSIQEDNMPTPKPKEKSIKFAALEANVQTPIHQGPTELTMTGFRRQVRQNLLVDTPKPSKVELAFQSLEDLAAGSTRNEEQATAETFSRLEDSFHQLNTFADELPQPVRLDEPIDLSQMQPEIVNSAKSTKTVSTSPLTILSPTFSRTSLHFQSQPNPLKQSSISVSTNFTTPASTKAENEPEKQLLQILTNKGTLVELETATELDLRESGIESLQGLNELVGGGQLVKCNLDKNKLRYLTGVPNSVIHLSLRTNRLTTLTSFSHMTNLQYLNISNNVVDDLIGKLQRARRPR